MTNIGVFDSGLGGLTVLRELVKNHKANYFYLGDNKNVPYGNKSKEEIENLSYRIVEFLLKKDIDFFIIACNTISVTAFAYLNELFDKKFIPITKPAISEVLKMNGDVFVMATKATSSMHYYKNQIEQKSNKRVEEIACPSLVDFIEKGYISGKKLDYDLKRYLKKANEDKISNIILGCTHYPIIESEIKKNLFYKANIIDPAKILNKDIDFEENDKTSIKIYMTKPNKLTQELAKKIMGIDIIIEKADI